MPWQPGQSASGQTTLLLEDSFLDVERIIFVISRCALEIFLGTILGKRHLSTEADHVLAAALYTFMQHTAFAS